MSACFAVLEYVKRLVKYDSMSLEDTDVSEINVFTLCLSFGLVSCSTLKPNLLKRVKRSHDSNITPFYDLSWRSQLLAQLKHASRSRQPRGGYCK